MQATRRFTVPAHGAVEFRGGQATAAVFLVVMVGLQLALAPATGSRPGD